MLTILQGDALSVLKTLPDEIVQCCVTSPPYWGLRDYGIPSSVWGGDSGCEHEWEAHERRGYHTGQGYENLTEWNGAQGPPKEIPATKKIVSGFCSKCSAWRGCLGLEPTSELYVAHAVDLFREVRRVMRKDGTLWLNIGDSYASSPAGNFSPGMTKPGDGGGYRENKPRMDYAASGLKAKDLVGIPWLLAFALRTDGWWLRSDIIWHKPNPMPESVTDRPTKSHEYIFLMTKSASYFYDAEAIKEPWTCSRDDMRTKGIRTGEAYLQNGIPMNHPEYTKPYNGKAIKDYDGAGAQNPSEVKARIVEGILNGTITGRNKRTVWTVATEPYSEAHFATFPQDLIKPCILAGTSAKGCCPKCGAPWERLVEKSGGTIGKSWHDHRNDLGQGQRSDAPSLARADNGNGTYKVRTLDWKPACQCFCIEDTPDPVPCTVLDPFGGSGTTGLVALEHGRKAILIELNPEYIKLARRRCDVTPGLQLA